MRRVERGFVSGLVTVLAFACSDGDGEGDGAGAAAGAGGTSSAPSVTFTRDIHPIFVAKCSASDCHDEPGFILPGHGSPDVNIAYESVTSTGSIGMPIYDRILVRIAATDPSFIMPPPYASPVPCEGAIGRPGCVTQAEFDLIKAWVDQGHPK
jgi:hypothetical protein